jgi:hypothetical protein
MIHLQVLANGERQYGHINNNLGDLRCGWIRVPRKFPRIRSGRYLDWTLGRLLRIRDSETKCDN